MYQYTERPGGTQMTVARIIHMVHDRLSAAETLMNNAG